MVQSLHSNGEFLDEVPEGEKDYPRSFMRTVLLLRSRAARLSAALQKVIEDIKTEIYFPNSLCKIIGFHNGFVDETNGGSSPQSDDSKIQTIEFLLSKPANPEQIQIAERLESAGAVLVQGPPGTGKTHTIANLIGHLLAQGKSVLVTAHTTKALRVLRDKVGTHQRAALCQRY